MSGVEGVPYACTTAVGSLSGLTLKYDEVGRAYFEGKVRLTGVDDYALLLQQSQATEIGMTFETKTTLIPLFPSQPRGDLPATLILREPQEERPDGDEVGS